MRVIFAAVAQDRAGASLKGEHLLVLSYGTSAPPPSFGRLWRGRDKRRKERARDFLVPILRLPHRGVTCSTRKGRRRSPGAVTFQPIIIGILVP